LADILFKISCGNKVVCGLRDYIREQILKDLCPDMKVMFGSGEIFGKQLFKARAH